MKLHPLSAVTHGLRRGMLAGSFVLVLVGGVTTLFSSLDQYSSTTFLLFPVAFVAGFGYQIQYDRRFEYELTADTLDISAGVFGRREREIPYRRVQNVDITESIFHRIVGVAVVDIETAGGSETEASLDFVTAEEARRLQQEIRERRRRVTEATGAPSDRTPAGGPSDRTPAGEPSDTTSTGGTAARTQTGGPADATSTTGHDTAPATTGAYRTPGPDSPAERLFELDTTSLLVYALGSVRLRSLVVLLVGLPVAQEWLLSFVTSLAGIEATPAALMATPDRALFAGLVTVVLGLLGTWAVSASMTVLEYYDFTLGRRGDDLVYERGLLQRYSGSIPTDKIQTVTITENVLLRQFDYAGVVVETAGYSPSQSQGGGGSQAAIPLTDRERALSFARSLEPFADLEFTRPPKRARRRYAVRYSLVVLAATTAFWLLAQLLPAFTRWYLPAVFLPLVLPAAHLKWVHLGYHAGEEQFVVRSGFWRRTTRVVPYYRLQTVFRERTIFQRRLGLAHLTADTATSSVLGSRDATALDIEADVARQLADQSRERLQTSIRNRAAS